MQYSLCIWGEAQVWTWGAHVVRGPSARYSYVSLNRTYGHRVIPGACQEIRGAWYCRQTRLLPTGDPVSMPAQLGST